MAYLLSIYILYLRHHTCAHAFQVWCLINHKDTHYLHSISSCHFCNFILSFLNLLCYSVAIRPSFVYSFLCTFLPYFHSFWSGISFSELCISSWLRLFDVRRKYDHLIPGLSRHKIEADVGDADRDSDLDLVKVLLMSCPRQTSSSTASTQLGHGPARGYCLRDFRFRICDQ